MIEYFICPRVINYYNGLICQCLLIREKNVDKFGIKKWGFIMCFFLGQTLLLLVQLGR